MIDDYYVDYINSTPLSIRTKRAYTIAYTSFWKDRIGSMDFDELDYFVIQDGLTELIDKYAFGTLKAYKYSVAKFLDIAWLKGKIDNKFDSKLFYIGSGEIKKDFNTDENELVELLYHLEKSHSKNREQYIMAIWIGYYTGMRIGEVLALRKENINLENETIEVEHNVTIVTKCGKETAVLSNVKTASSVRTIYMPRELKIKLANYLDKVEGDILLPDRNGNYIMPVRLSSYIRNFARPRGYTIHFHILRAMYVKKFFNAGISMEIVRCLLGHKNISTTVNIYLRTNGEERKAAVDKVFS